jgi:hypothetical protein
LRIWCCLSLVSSSAVRGDRPKARVTAEKVIAFQIAERMAAKAVRFYLSSYFRILMMRQFRSLVREVSPEMGGIYAGGD